MRRGKGFTLIELLVVISVIALLMALLLPALQRARNQARAVVCQSRLKQWGPALASYLQDNEGCFPRYRRPDDIAWFSRSLIMGSADPNTQSARGALSGVACCPMAFKRFGRRSFTVMVDYDQMIRGQRGAAFEAWELSSPSPGSSFRASYGFNAFLFSNSFKTAIRTHTHMFHSGRVNIDSITGRANIPVLLDSAMPGGEPRASSLPPRRIRAIRFSMDPFCSNRHGERTNGLLLDWSVRRLGLKELWTLRWNMQFDRAGPWTKAGGALPEDWPHWMRGFKDY